MSDLSSKTKRVLRVLNNFVICLALFVAFASNNRDLQTNARVTTNTNDTNDRLEKVAIQLTELFERTAKISCENVHYSIGT
jgi:hypothetical protein